MDKDTFDLQDIKSGAVSLCFDILYSLILAADIVIYLSFVVIKWQSFEIGRVTLYNIYNNYLHICVA